MEGTQLFFLFLLRHLLPLPEKLNTLNIAEMLETNFHKFEGFFNPGRALA
jgi:hypothetical protein